MDEMDHLDTTKCGLDDAITLLQKIDTNYFTDAFAVPLSLLMDGFDLKLLHCPFSSKQCAGNYTRRHQSSDNNFGNIEIRPFVGWVGSANTTAVLH